tara:strand:+ start:45 stop:653 length:609 start_codon:yes stop_codon:yes gene_type:complete
MQNKADIFPVSILGFDLKSLAGNVDYIVNDILLSDQHDNGINGSLSKNQQVLDSLIYKDVVDEIYLYLNEYIEYCNHDVKGIKIVSSWSNIVNIGERIQPHKHSNSYICGVIHLTDGSELAFKKPNIKKFFQIDTNYKSHEDTLFKIPAEKGQLILFPSNLTHVVLDQTNPQTRVSIAFNTWPLQYGSTSAWVDLTERKQNI